MYDITKTCFSPPFLRYHFMMSTILSYTFSHILPMISTSYDIGYDFGYDILFDINNFLYHSPLISEFSESFQIFHDFEAEIMVLARRDGAACGRHAPAAPPPPASPFHAKRRCIEAIGASSMDLDFKLEWYYSSSCGTGMASQRSPGRPVGRCQGKCSSCYYVLGI